jgi:hypothetical protein
VETIGRTDTPKERIENLLHVRQFHFPEQTIDWEYLLDEFVEPSEFHFKRLFQERMRFLFTCSMSKVVALGNNLWYIRPIYLLSTLKKLLETNLIPLLSHPPNEIYIYYEVRLTKKISSIIMYSYNFLMSAYEYFPRFP